ncbi:MAG: PHP domain-containing protein, partial [Lentisphaerae bacterium]|nr:PHP domain-containing protein [Lentisphaerota bacterium]
MNLYEYTANPKYQRHGRHGAACQKSFLFFEQHTSIRYVNRNTQFVHLHVHTKFSLLDGACHLDQLMDFALENNMPAMAITDHGVMYGAVDFYKAAKSKGIKPIIGCEFYVAPTSRFDKTGARPNHLVLLASDETGYSNLIYLASMAHLEGFYYKPRIDKALLAERSKGLIGLSACLQGGVASKLLQEDVDGAVKETGEYTDILGKDNFFLEVQDHGLRDQHKVNKLLPIVSNRSGTLLVATNDV